MPRTLSSFRTGRVKGYLRGSIWYLCYHENGKRRRPRAGPDLDAARKLAAQINGQLESGACPILSFEPIGIAALRGRWLEHHEQVLRSAVTTISRYRAATDHLLTFVNDVRPIRLAAHLQSSVAQEFVTHLRTVQVASNGRRGAAKRPLMDKGIKFILECCRALFNYAAKRRHLPPYAENPFSAIQIERMPVENSKPIVLLTSEQERRFLEACDHWQFPVFLTLMLTGLRPGELAHLLLPDDLDLVAGVLRVRNKVELGWTVKTRNERDVPLLPELGAVLRVVIGVRRAGPVFLRPGFRGLDQRSLFYLQKCLADKVAAEEKESGAPLSRARRLAIGRSLWWEIGAIREDQIRREFIRVARKIGMATATMPKLLRHLFATGLQDANVDPLIRNQLMGHAPSRGSGPGYGLGMTAVYTHSRAETVRGQLTLALEPRPAVLVAREWLRAHESAWGTEADMKMPAERQLG